MVRVNIKNVSGTVDVDPYTTCENLRDRFSVANMIPVAYGKRYQADTTMREIARDNGIDLDNGVVTIEFQNNCTIMKAGTHTFSAIKSPLGNAKTCLEANFDRRL